MQITITGELSELKGVLAMLTAEAGATVVAANGDDWPQKEAPKRQTRKGGVLPDPKPALDELNKPTPAPPPAEEPPAEEPTPEPTPEPEPKGATLEDAVKIATDLVAAGHKDKVRAALDTAGAKRVSELKGAALEQFMQAVSA